MYILLYMYIHCKCYSVRVITLSVILVSSLYSFTHLDRHVNTQSTMLQKKVIIVTQCYYMLSHKVLQTCNITSVNHYICNVVNTSFFLICVFMCIYIPRTPVWPMHTRVWGANMRHMTCSCCWWTGIMRGNAPCLHKV